MATIVLAHGAWSSAWAWKKMRPLMAASGHTFFTPTYTGMGERAHLDSPSIDLDTNIQDVLSVIETEELSEVVLLGHSYGGMVATGVADRARTQVKHLIYLDAFVPNDGQSLADMVPPAQRLRMEEAVKSGDGWRVAPNPTPDDTSDADKAWVMRHRKPQSAKCFFSPLKLRNGPLTVRRSFILCKMYDDRGPFRDMRAQAEKAGWPCYEIETSHSPNITAPDMLMKILDRVIAGR